MKLDINDSVLIGAIAAHNRIQHQAQQLADVRRGKIIKGPRKVAGIRRPMSTLEAQREFDDCLRTNWNTINALLGQITKEIDAIAARAFPPPPYWEDHEA